MNPLFNQIGNATGNPLGIFQRIMQFQQNYTGNPKEDVQKIITSGRFTQAQINQFQQMANTIQSMMGHK